MTAASGPRTAPARRHEAAHRRDFMWLVALVHRLSGLALAAFLPLHFLVLALAISGEAALDGFLQWTHHPLVKFAEAGLVGLLVVHLLGGIRLLTVEFLPWRNSQKTLAVVALAVSVVAGVWFLLRAL